MKTRYADKTQIQSRELDICLGNEGTCIGQLSYVKDGSREFSSFAYRDA